MSVARVGGQDVATDGADAETGVLRVVVAEDHPLMLDVLATTIDRHADLSVVATARSGPDAVDAYRREQPDVLLCDYALPSMTALEVTERVRRVDPAARVLILSAFSEPEKVSAAVAAGAAGYLTKTVEASSLPRQIRDVAAGNAAFDSTTSKVLAEHMRGGGGDDEQLTLREREVLTLLAEGCTNTQVARRLFISPQTVKTHLERIYDKLDVSSRTRAVALAMQERLIPVDLSGQR